MSRGAVATNVDPRPSGRDASRAGALFLGAATVLCLVSLALPGFVRAGDWRLTFSVLTAGLAVMAVVVFRRTSLPNTLVLTSILAVDGVILLAAACLTDRAGSRVVATLFALPTLYLGLYAATWMMGPQVLAVTAGAATIMLMAGELDSVAVTAVGTILVSVFTPAVAVLVLRRRLVAALRQAKALSSLDPLTGLASTGGIALGVVVADIDHFKRINDVHGHAVGDEVLRLVAEAVRSCVRQSDVVVRLGGEEIAVLAAVVPADLADLAERIRVRVAGATAPWPVTVSLGAAWAADARLDGDPLELAWALVDEADDLMYVAKRAGRNRVSLPAGTDARRS